MLKAISQSEILEEERQAEMYKEAESFKKNIRVIKPGNLKMFIDLTSICFYFSKWLNENPNVRLERYEKLRLQNVLMQFLEFDIMSPDEASEYIALARSKDDDDE